VLAVLKRGQQVTVHQQAANGWWEVSAEINGASCKGFVSSSLLQEVGASDRLKDLVASGISLTIEQLKSKPRLVLELQTRLRNLGYYPGGQWLDSQLGSQTSSTWKGWKKFCSDMALAAATPTKAIDGPRAKVLLETKSVPKIFEKARDLVALRQSLSDIHQRTPRNSPYPPFSDRGIKTSPFADHIQRYPSYLAAMQPDGVATVSHGPTLTLSGLNPGAVRFDDYPSLGARPVVETGQLSFLPSTITKACICVGSFLPGEPHIKTHWLGKNHLLEQEYWSSTKFIAPLHVICRLGAINPNIDVDDCEVGYDDSSQSTRTHNFNRLVEHMVAYEEKKIAPSNRIAATFKRFATRKGLEDWLISVTGNSGLSFRGYYGGGGPFITNPVLIDKSPGRNEIVMRHAPEVGSGANRVASYDMVRIISMLGWHLHLQQDSLLPAAQWMCLESMVRAMAFDPARYVDLAFETLGVVDHIANPVVISKLGSGFSQTRGIQEDTCVAFVSFVDTRQRPGRLHTLAFALHASGSTDQVHDVDLAVAVTEIIRRSMALELA
jgi:hypothetical protein